MRKRSWPQMQQRNCLGSLVISFVCRWFVYVRLAPAEHVVTVLESTESSDICELLQNRIKRVG
jgi:hypothetical protein